MGALQSVEEGFPPSPQAGAATPELIDRKLESALASASPRAQKAIQQVAELVRRQSQIQPWVEQREDEFRQRENELQWREIELDGTAAELERSFKADMELQATNMETIAAHAAALRMHESKEAQLTSALQEMESTNVKLHKTTADSEALLLQKHAASMSHASAQMAAQAEAHKANGVVQRQGWSNLAVRVFARASLSQVLARCAHQICTQISVVHDSGYLHLATAGGGQGHWRWLQHGFDSWYN